MKRHNDGLPRPMQQRHDALVARLVTRLRMKSHLDILVSHATYTNGPLSGEVDALGYANGRWRFYEVKVNQNEASYNHALDQYWRYCKAHPDRDVIGIYVTGTCVERLPRYRHADADTHRAAAEGRAMATPRSGGPRPDSDR